MDLGSLLFVEQSLADGEVNGVGLVGYVHILLVFPPVGHCAALELHDAAMTSKLLKSF